MPTTSHKAKYLVLFDYQTFSDPMTLEDLKQIQMSSLFQDRDGKIREIMTFRLSILIPLIKFDANQKLLFKDGDPVSSLGPSKHVNKHRFIRQSQANTTYTFIQKISINTHT